MKEHDSKTCHICKELGDWTDTPDTMAWIDAHTKEGLVMAVTNDHMTELPGLQGKDTALSKFVGLGFRVSEDFKRFGVTPKDLILSCLLNAAGYSKPGSPLFEVTMPCGYHIAYPNKESLPNGTVPCPSCGNPNHFVVLFEWTEAKSSGHDCGDCPFSMVCSGSREAVSKALGVDWPL